VTPTYLGRIQTRLFLVATVGLVWTAILMPMLPHGLVIDMGMSAGPNMLMNRVMLPVGNQLSTVSMDYDMGFAALGLMAAAGLVWDGVYQGLQRRRREGDWPPLFMLAAGIPEGVVVWLLLHVVGVTAGSLGPSNSTFPLFAVQFSTTWVLFWLAMLGPLRVVSIRWHHRGMEFVGPT
jgi:hypothetical protein